MQTTMTRGRNLAPCARNVSKPLGHHQIQGDDVWIELFDLGQGVEPVARDAHDFDARFGLQHVAQYFAGKCRVGDDQDARRFHVAPLR